MPSPEASPARLRAIDGVRADRWLVDASAPFRSGSAAIRDGRLDEIGTAAAAGAVVGGAGTIVLPAPVDAHDHGRGLRSLSYGHVDLPFEIWMAGHGLHPAADPALLATVALGRIARGGACGSVHLHRPMRYDRLVDEARAVAKAATQIGIRLAFVVPMTDRQSLAYMDDRSFLALYGSADRDEIERRLLRSRPPPHEQIALAEEIAGAIAGSMVDVQLGPGAPQWCSDPLIAAIADHSARTGKRVHMHLLETQRQRAWADAHHPGGLIAHLDALGLLSSRLTVAHGVWLRTDELALLSARGVKVAINTSSNLRLRSGLADIAALKRHGVRFALGLDGLTYEDDDDILREMRLTYHLHAGSDLDDAAVGFADILNSATAVGREVLDGMPAGGPGKDADLLLIDRARLMPDLIVEAGQELAALTARATAQHVSHLIVAGREVVRDRKVLGIDLGAAERELASSARAAAPDGGTLDFVRHHRGRLRAFYAAGHHRAGG
jgi:cytosine/adenosine deaminase-related metal-dependent hydrolase